MITETVFDFPSPLAHDHVDPLLELNLKVAAIAGWENIQEWNPSHKPRKVFQGTNKKHPELGIFVPDYVRDLNAIVTALNMLGLNWLVNHHGFALHLNTCDNPFLVESHGESPAIALCKLLLELTPDPSDVKIIDEDGEVDEPTVIE